MRLDRRGWLLVLLSIAGGLLLVGFQAYGLGPRFLASNLVDSATYGVLAVLALATVIQFVIWWRRLSEVRPRIPAFVLAVAAAG